MQTKRRRAACQGAVVAFDALEPAGLGDLPARGHHPKREGP
jgi:hypothetical protein